MTDTRFSHEDTAADRWVGAMLDVSRRDGPERVDALVEAAVDGVRAARTRGARRAGARWRAPLAAAASIAVVAGAVLFLSPQPASADALLRAAHAAERGAGDRRYRLELSFPPRPGSAAVPKATGTLDVRDASHVRLELAMPEGRTMVRGMDGDVSWTLSPSGEVLRLPQGAPWPRFVETPEGDLLVDRLDAMLGDIGAFYSIERCDAAGEVRLCAQRADGGFRGPERIELTLDPATKSVTHAVMTFAAPPSPPHGAGPGAGRGPEGRRPAPPTRIEITRVDLPGGFEAARFAPPGEPVGDAPVPPDAGRPHERGGMRGGRPPHGDGPPPFDGPPQFDGPPPHGDRPPHPGG